MNLLVLAGMLAVFLLSGCGKSSATGDATAKLVFAKGARFFALDAGLDPMQRVVGTPDEFKMKLIAAYLTADIDPVTQNNVGTTTMIYLNPTCGTDIMHCNTDNTSHGGLAEDGAPWATVITDFFDFSDSAVANAALNSQGRSIQSGTYKYARLEFCKYADAGSAANIKWMSTADGVGTEQSFSRAQCTVNSAVFATPLVIPSGGSATVTLTYSLTGKVVANPGATAAECAVGAGAVMYCFNLPDFVPSATL